MPFLQKNWRGILMASMLGMISLFLAQHTSATFNSVMIALVLGIAIGNLVKIPDGFSSGIDYTSAKLLELSILFLAFSINYNHIAQIGANSFVGIVLVVFFVLILTVFFTRKLNCPRSLGWLIGFGTAICGSSAIAAFAPSVTKDKEDVAVSMAVVNLFGTLGMLFLPVFLLQFDLNPTQMGMLIGGGLHSVGNVAGSGYTIGKEAGEAALTIKLARVALLSPGLIFINFLINRKTTQSWKDHFKLPWYLIGFIIITIIGSLTTYSESFVAGMESIGKVVLTVAMASIGLKVSFSKIISSGKRGLSFGLLMFMVLLFSLSGLIVFIG